MPENAHKPPLTTLTTTTTQITSSPQVWTKEEETRAPSLNSFQNACDKHCSPWSEWSTCGINCGGGFRVQSRERICSAQLNLYACKTLESKSCNVECLRDYEFVADEGLCLRKRS